MQRVATPLLLPTLYVPHGGGPLPILRYPCHTGMDGFLGDLAQRVPEKPKGILLVSAHWEEEHPQLTSAMVPGMLYDYYGFPPETYSLKYPAPGDPQLAAKAANLLKSAGFKASLNPERALDHGAFIPLKLIYPAADIPVVQLSLKSNLDPEEHYLMGAALAPLRSEGVLLLASGMSFHNMGLLRVGTGQAPQPNRDPATVPGQDFNTWLINSCLQGPQQRRQLLANWSKAPGARIAHPREEHLIPLMVVAGAASGESSSSSSSGSGSGSAAGSGTCSSSPEDSKGHLLWTGEVMGSAVAGIAFGQVLPEHRSPTE